MSNMLYYLAAFGSPNVDIKYSILTHNLNYIHDSIKTKFDLFVNVYDNTMFETFINKNEFPFLNNITIHRKKGILSELWIDNPYHDTLSTYDNIVFILDDVKIHKLNMASLINIKKQYNIEFLSPAVHKATWSYMKPQNNNSLVFTNRIEIFCLLLNYKDFIIFLNLNSIDNPNMWGVDYMMSHYKIKCAIYKECVVEHMFKSASDHLSAINQMDLYFKHHGFDSRKDFLLKYPNDIDYINTNIINNKLSTM
jgi:hypothetical protein